MHCSSSCRSGGSTALPCGTTVCALRKSEPAPGAARSALFAGTRGLSARVVGRVGSRRDAGPAGVAAAASAAWRTGDPARCSGLRHRGPAALSHRSRRRRQLRLVLAPGLGRLALPHPRAPGHQHLPGLPGILHVGGRARRPLCWQRRAAGRRRPARRHLYGRFVRARVARPGTRPGGHPANPGLGVRSAWRAPGRVAGAGKQPSRHRLLPGLRLPPGRHPPPGRALPRRLEGLHPDGRAPARTRIPGPGCPAGRRHVIARLTGRPLVLLNVFVTGLVNLYTRDIEAGLRFYRDLLGFTETFRTPLEGVPEHVEFRLGGFTVGLGTVEAAMRVHGVAAEPGSPAMVLVVWTDDVDKAHAELAAAGMPVIQAPHDTGNNNRNALLRDPDGNLVEIVAKAS